MIPYPSYIYHITNASNLRSVIRNRGLVSYNLMSQQNISYTNMAYASVQDRRASTTVTLAPYGNLHDYVPFYFGPRSPMLYAIKGGCVEGYTHGQRPVIHLVTTVQEIARIGSQFVFTDGHAIMAYSTFYKELGNLNVIDWDLMDSKYWNDTPQYPNRKWKRQAEFLVYQSVPWESFTEIGVFDEGILQQVREILKDNKSDKKVKVKPEWYYC